MTDSDGCPVCGRELPADAPQGLCPRCLLQQGLADGGLISRQGSEASSIASLTSNHRSGSAAKLGSMRVVLLRSDESGNDAPGSRLSSSDLRTRPVESGRYQLFDEIGRGGMGAILKGRDPDLGRDLAVKVLLEEHREHPELVRRFVEEAQIGGQLQHPGVVPVHELGVFPDDRPYFTMKLVRGRTLAALLGARKDLSDERARLLAIFEQVCQTMAYAHSRGVIHRDLKPSNVMVGSFGEVQVMDWGLAKVLKAVRTDDDGQAEPRVEADVQTVRHGSSVDISRVGSVLGTPAYMAPEQARGETDRVDERVDVFGLGAILCEALTGRPPYVGRTTAEVRELAVAANVVDARDRLLACGADAELISLASRCLAPMPQDRPQDAGAVAADMTAYLRGVQERLKQAELARVEAQANSAQEKTRRRLAVGLAAAIVALMATLGGGWTWREADRQRRAARVDLALRDVEVLTAEAESAGDDPVRWVSAREAARRAAQVLDDARDGVTRARVAAIVKEVGERADEAESDGRLLIRLAEIGDALTEDPSSQNDAAYTSAFREAGLDVNGGPPEELGRAIARRPPRVVVAIASALDHWAVVRLDAGDRDGAARLTAVARAADPDEWRGRLRTALMESGKDTQLSALKKLARSALATDLPAASVALLGAALVRVGDYQSAESVLRPAQRRYPDDLWLALYLARALFGLSRGPEGLRYNMVARAIRPQAAHALAHALAHVGEGDEAIAVLREAIRANPTKSADSLCLGKILKNRGRDRDADEVLDRGITVARERVQLRPDDAFAHLVFGTILGERGRLEEAAAELSEAIRLLPSYAFVHHSLGVTRHRQGRVDDEIAEFREAIRLDPHNPAFRMVLAASLAEHVQLAQAIAALREAIRVMPDVADLHFDLGVDLDRDGRLDDAIDQYKQTIRLAPDYAKAHYNLALALNRKDRIGQAIAECRETIRLKPDFAEAHGTLAFQLQCAGQYAESLIEYERCHELGSKRGDWPYQSGKWVEHARRLVRIEPKAAALFRGEPTPADATEYLDLALIAHNKRMYATAADLSTKAFAIDSKLEIDRIFGSRYLAATAAAAAGCGKGTDEPSLDEPAKVKLRGQALDWLKAELAARSRIAVIGLSKDRDEAQTDLQYWKTDVELASVRDRDGLAVLPEVERTKWQVLWREVDGLLTQLRSHSHAH